MFSRAAVLKLHTKRIAALAAPVLSALPLDSLSKKSKKSAVIAPTSPDFSHLSTTTVLKKVSALATVMLVATSFSPSNAQSEGAFSAQYFMSHATHNTGAILVSDDDGYLRKISPQTGEADRSTMTDKASHVVAAGDTLSGIAAKYGVSSQTILWENNIKNKNSIRSGQKLIIPPVDGVTHKVKQGETLDKVAKMYKVDNGLIAKQNRLKGQYLYTGQELIIPGGKRIVATVPKKVTTSRRSVGRTATSTRTNLKNNTSSPVAGKSMIFPTRGTITQRYHRGHYAYDIADVSRPPVWAMSAGTVVKASSGTWGGGYGNHIIVDHGNGLKSLYAHLEYLSVKKGDYIAQGQVVGRMGRTGRVYGRTGIHLHVEVHKNGVKMNPAAFW